jgi:DNA-binding winged helix-turn-helix (wHTH) protein
MNPIFLKQYEFGPFRLDSSERRLLREGEPVPLSPKVFDLLFVLVRRPGQILEKEELLRAVWPDTIVEENNLSVNISALRKALGEGPNQHTYIETLPRRGYRFIAPVSEVTDQERPDQERVEDIKPSVSIKPSRRLRKPGALLASLAVATALVAGFAYAWRKMAPGSASDAESLSRVVPFSSFQGRESSPAFSPDGNQIAFVWSGEQDDNLDIYVKLIDGGSPLRLTTDAADDLNPVWSPDGATWRSTGRGRRAGASSSCPLLAAASANSSPRQARAPAAAPSRAG